MVQKFRLLAGNLTPAVQGLSCPTFYVVYLIASQFSVFGL